MKEKSQKRCVVYRKFSKQANYLLVDYYSKDILFRNVCRNCVVKISEKLTKDTIKRKYKNRGNQK